jgi:hypothetical protein
MTPEKCGKGAPQFQTAIAIPANRRLSAATRAMLETIEHHTK